MPAVRRPRTVFLTTLVLVAVVAPLAALGARTATDGDAPGKRHRPALADLLDRIPLGFEANQGQYAPEVRFVARAPGHTVLLTDGGLVVSTPGNAGSAVRIGLDGARPDAVVAGGEPLAARANQFLGDDPNMWQTGVETFRRVSYRDVYPGIDVVFHGNGRYVEHDFLVAPGADPAAIRLAFTGTAGSRVDGNGDLVLPVGTDEVRLRAPQLYQKVDGRRRAVEGRFDRRPDGTVGFRVGAYDQSRPLVIDPVVVSASYLGGTSTETAYGVAVDVDGNIVVAGYTESSDFPAVSPMQANLVQSEGARTDAFVTKVKADGTSILWSTYLGGKGRDAALSVAVGGDGTVYVTGYTESSDFPTNRPLQASNAGGANDAFVAKLNQAGSALEYSTYLGGKGAETGSGIAVDATGSAYVVGHTSSADFPTAKPFQGSVARPDDVDGFVAKVQPGGSGLAYSSFLGGGGDDHLTDVAVDGEGSAVVVGDTRAADFPIVRGFQGTLGGTAGTANATDGVVAKIRPDGSGLVYGSFLGGTDSDKATAVALDVQGNVYISGNTGSVNFPVLNAFQPKKDGDFDAFVTKLKADGNLAYSSFLGGNGSDGGEAIAVDRQGRAYVAGATASNNFPSVKAFQGKKSGGFVDAFLTQVAANGQSLVSSSYLGGRDDEQAAGVAVDGEGNLAVVGYTNSPDFPTAKPFQPQTGGGVGDAFVLKVRADVTASASGSTPAATKRERRVRTLVTITGGLLIAAALQTLWIRRRPEPAGRPTPEPVPTGREVELPGLQYTPRRGRGVPDGPTRTGPFAPSAPIKRAEWDRRQPVGLAVKDEELDDDDFEPLRPRRPKAKPAWDEPQRPVLRPLERVPDGDDGPRVPVPDLWGSDAPLAEAAASVRAGRAGATERPMIEDPLEDLSDPDRWTVASIPARAEVAELDPNDVWGPLVVEQDPDEWAEEWGVTGLLETTEAGGRPPFGRAPGAPIGPAGARPEERAAAEAAARAEREAAEAAERAAEAKRVAQEAAAAETAAREAAEQAERRAAELAAQDAADVWGPPVEVAEPEVPEPEVPEPELPEPEVAEPEDQAAVAAQREARERAEAEAAEQRAAAERAALRAAIEEAAEREAMAMRADAERRAETATAGQPVSATVDGSDRQAAGDPADQAAELERVAEARAEAARAAQAARATAQAEAAEATRRAEAAQAEARAAAQAAALQAALAAFEAAEAEAARIAEADAARLAAQVAAQVAEAHAARIASEAAAAARAEEEARARAEAQLEAERQAAEAAEAAARAQADADARAAAAATAAAEAERRARTPALSPDDGGPVRARSDTVTRAEQAAEEARLAEARAAEAAEAAAAAERAEREAAETAERAEREAAEAKAAEAREAERRARQLLSPEERAAERQAAAARAAEARAAEARASAARAAQVRAAEARAAEARAAEARAAEARAAQVRAADARAAQVRAAEVGAPQARAVPAPRPAPAPRSAQPPHAAPAFQPAPAPPPAPPAAGGPADLSLSELLDEDLPIPEAVAGQRREEWDRRRLDQVLDEDFPVPDAAQAPRAAQPVAPPPRPSGLVGATTGPAAPQSPPDEVEEVLPPPPPRLLANLFEPDPDDPLVQSTQSLRDRGHDG